MADDRAQYQEPDDHVHHLRQVGSVKTLAALVSYLTQEFFGDVQVEDGGNANGSEVAEEEGAAEVFDLVDAFVEDQDHWQAAEEQD